MLLWRMLSFRWSYCQVSYLIEVALYTYMVLFRTYMCSFTYMLHFRTYMLLLWLVVLLVVVAVIVR